MSILMERPATGLAGKAQMTAAEWQARCDLAAAYRLVAMFGWDDLLATHLSARVPGSHDAFLINPLGLLFEEITASSLVKVNVAGDIIEDTEYSVNKTAFVIHGALHEAKPDLDCIIHLHGRSGVAVSALPDGLLPLNQTAMIIRAQLARHAFEGVALDEQERVRLVDDLGDKRLMLLDHHGTLTAGESVAEAFYYAYTLEWACDVQVRVLSMRLAHDLPDAEAQRKTEALLGEHRAEFAHVAQTLTWPALLRRLERHNPGHAV